MRSSTQRLRRRLWSDATACLPGTGGRGVEVGRGAEEEEEEELGDCIRFRAACMFVCKCRCVTTQQSGGRDLAGRRQLHLLFCLPQPRSPISLPISLLGWVALGKL